MNKLDTKKLSFAPENNIGYADWETDWETHRRYVNPVTAIRVWEGGSVELVASTDGHPEQRLELSRLGIHVFLRDELPEISTIDGGKLAKAWLDNEMYVVDYPSRRVFALTGRPIGKECDWGSPPPLGYRLRWGHPNSVPYSAYPACAWVPDRKKAKQWMRMNECLLIAAKGIAALEGKHMVEGFEYLCNVMMKAAPSQLELAAVGASIGSTAFNKAVARITATRLSEPHFVLR